MAKMFYSLSEAAQRLGKSEDDVRQMAGRGEIQEFRDGDKLIFKVDQIELLVQGDDDHDSAEMSSMIPLADTSAGTSLGIDLTDSGFGTSAGRSGAGSGAGGSAGGSGGGSALSDSGSMAGMSGSVGLDVSDTGGKTGISVFDADDLDEADPSAVTQVSDGGGFDGLNLDSVGSGSGLMDLTRESDDTSLGADGLLDDIFAEGDTDSGSSGETVAAADTGLFEGTSGIDEGEGEAVGVGSGVMVGAVEVYDGRGSGLAGGLMFGATLSLALALAILILSMMGQSLTIPFVGQNTLMLLGIMGGVTLIAGVLGFLVFGKK